MNGNDLIQAGYSAGKALGAALSAAKTARANGAENKAIKLTLIQVLHGPEAFLADPLYGDVAHALMDERRISEFYDLETPVNYRVWGRENIDPEAIAQMDRAARLPVAVRGALMPDAHVGYGLPIGGVLAVENAVIPYAVGVDIACRMRLTIYEASPYLIDQRREALRRILEQNTMFGAGSGSADPADRFEHPVMDDPAWDALPLLRGLKGIAWRQLGSSGSGNHFVEFGALDVLEPLTLSGAGQADPVADPPVVAPGRYLALLSHSGSRRVGFEIASHYTEIAMNARAALPKEYRQLAWLGLDEGPGAEYWLAMNLAGRFASANHAVIHARITEALRLPVAGHIENHHNFAWQEMIDGKPVVVHRKGATPAGSGILGIIPGSMGAPGFVVRGLGSAASINSASHGAGRRMSRSQALKAFEWADIKRKLKAQGIELISGGLDEAPGAYKDIRQVMTDQADLVTAVAEFQPKLVKMDGSGSRAED
jgi:tRNA-splicing ligase RtcB